MKRRKFGQASPGVVRFMYWTIRKDPTAILHLLGTFWRILPNYLRVRSWLKADPEAGLIIVKVEHIGDIVAAEPIGRHARDSSPGRPILWVVDRRYAALVRSFGCADRILPVQCVTDWILLSRLVRRPEVWNLHIDGHCCPRCQVPVRGNMRSGLNFSNYYNFGNLTEVQCLLADLPKLQDPPSLPVSATVRRQILTFLPSRRYFVVHCKSNHSDRDWTDSGWQRLVDKLIACYGVTVVEVGLEAIAVQKPDSHRRSLCGQLDIMQTAEAIRGAALFIGIDSGPAHLANAVGTPGVILLGEYRGFAGHMPFSGGYGSGELAEIVRSNGPVSAISLERVMEAVERRVAPVIVSKP
jgi:heptosyltransferase-3